MSAFKRGGLICSTQHPLLYDHRIFKIFKIFKIFNSTFHPNTLHLMRRANPVLTNYLAGLKSECQGLLRSAGNVVINFGLQWSLQTTAKLKSSIESDLSVHTGRRKHRHPENTQCWCKCLGPLSQENEEYKISTKSLNHQHVSTFFIMIQCLKRSPLNPRPRPRPSSSLASTAALASRSRWTIALWPFSAATSSGVAPQDPARPTRTQDPTKGRKLWKNFGHFRNCDHSKTVLTCLEAMRLFKTSC